MQGQHERCVSVLLENHADPNLVDINGNTALHLAANIPSISTAVLLLEHDADPNAQNKVILCCCLPLYNFLALNQIGSYILCSFCRILFV